MTPTDAERQAIERAARSGWFEEDQNERLQKLNELEERIASLPGYGTDDATLIPDVMAGPLPTVGRTPLDPTAAVAAHGRKPWCQRRFDEWEFSDSIREIDWLSTLIQRGADLGAAQPVKRISIAEVEGYDVRLWQPRIEIYLDVSGSMPNPIYHLNAMTLAAQILTLGATRAGGTVRAALYSHEPVLYWSWCRSEIEISKFLMH